MKQSQVIKIPAPLHTQFKTLAAKRGKTMVDLVHDVVRDAIARGELEDEVPGLGILIDLDNGGFERFITISATTGDFPRMTPADARAVAQRLAEIEPGAESVRFKLDEGGQWSVRFVGTSIELWAAPWDGQNPAKFTMTVALARAFASQLQKAAEDPKLKS